jgi:Protein of unknown function (DUF4038)/Putative collagen-binding domain of a collagenase
VGVVAPGALPRFPLKVAGGGRYLVDQGGVPFRLNAEAAWFLSTQASGEDVVSYLDDRRSRGFTAAVVMAMVHGGGYRGFPGVPEGAIDNAPNNLHTGEGPFTTPGDFGTMNERYWSHIDAIVDQAARRGMVIVLAYLYLGFEGGDQGWWREVNEARNDRGTMFGYGRALGERYRDRPNIIWYTCGDFSPPAGSEGSHRVRRTVAGIRSVLPDALFAAEMNPPDDLATDNPDFADLLDLESFYGFGPGQQGAVYLTANRAWAGRPPRPAFVGEPPYEGTPIGSSGGRVEIRRAQYYAVLGGGTAGQNFGTAGVWSVVHRCDGLAGCVDFRTGLDSPGTRDMQVQFRLYASLPWFDLVPSGTAPGFAGRDLVARGQGGGLSHIAAAVTGDGTWLLAYAPPAATPTTSFGIDLAALRGPARARWYNPVSGDFIHIADGLPGAGVRQFTTPGENGTGTNDWVLVLDRTG